MNQQRLNKYLLEILILQNPSIIGIRNLSDRSEINRKTNTRSSITDKFTS
jgi:hypothetical protein